MKTKTILALLKSARESAPCELEHGLVKLPRNELQNHRNPRKDGENHRRLSRPFQPQRRMHGLVKIQRDSKRKARIASDLSPSLVENLVNTIKLPHKNYPNDQIRLFKGERLQFLGTSFMENGQEIVHFQRIDKEGFSESAVSIEGWESLPIQP